MYISNEGMSHVYVGKGSEGRGGNKKTLRDCYCVFNTIVQFASKSPVLSEEEKMVGGREGWGGMLDFELGVRG